MSNMDFHVITLFPDQVSAYLRTSMTGRAIENGTIGLDCINIRDFAHNHYGKIDDTMYGGGTGLLIYCDPVYDAYKSIADKLEEKSGLLSERNAKDVKPLFDALRQNIDEFRKAAESARESNVKLGGELSARIEEVGRKAQSLGRQADDFVTALRGGNKNQGNWGEGIVRNVLEGAGLRPDADFIEQHGASDAGMPDFTVLDGTHRKILIDAKVNIDAFLAADQAAKEGRAEEAEKLLGEHAKRVRTQVANLFSKNYPAKLKESDSDLEAEYSPVVIMAMPSEATYSAAITADPQLVSYANEHAVVLASPQMLFGYLVLFKIGMDRLKVDRNNQNISNRARQILERMDAAFAALEKIGKSLDSAQEQYHEAMRKLGGENGAQNILVPARELAKLASKTKKPVSLAMQQADAVEVFQ